MDKNLLEYQKLEGKILSLKREMEKDVAKQTLNKVVVLVKENQTKLLELEDKAKVSIQNYEKFKVDYEKTITALNELSKEDVSTLNEQQLNANLEKANNLVNSLSFLERNLSSQAENIANIIKSFEICRNNIVLYKQKYKESKLKCDENENAIKPQIEELKKQMLVLEKQIDANLLNKYKHLRQDKIFPVLVPLNNNSCGGCSMQVPAALMEKLKANGYLECEQCRRCIYI